VTVTFDTNVLLYAPDEASPFHERARAFVEEVAAGPAIVYLFWPAVMGYLRLATHPAVFHRPLPPDDARANVESLLARPHVQTPGERERFWEVYHHVSGDVDARGNLVPDAHLVSLMLENGVGTIWTHDRDYRMFGDIEVRDPFE
jgi:toxin-antitoxin system PIN domain toxin